MELLKSNHAQTAVLGELKQLLKPTRAPERAPLAS